MILDRHNFTNKALILTAIGLMVVGGAWYLRPGAKPAKSDVMPDVDLSMLSIPKATSEPVKVESQAVRYLSIDDGSVKAAEQKQLKQQLNHLKRAGSLSGGVLTDEFKQATHAKMTYRFGRKQPLSFEPTQIELSGFFLTGRQYEGVLGERGYDALYRLFENPSNKSRIEIIETRILEDSPVVMYQEFMNKTIAGTPVLYEHLTDKKAVNYQKARFVHKDKLYVINAKGLTQGEFESLLTIIIQ